MVLAGAVAGTVTAAATAVGAAGTLNGNLFLREPIRNYFSKKKQTNSTLLLVDLFLFVFWKKVKTTKRHFKIN